MHKSQTEKSIPSTQPCREVKFLSRLAIVVDALPYPAAVHWATDSQARQKGCFIFLACTWTLFNPFKNVQIKFTCCVCVVRPTSKAAILYTASHISVSKRTWWRESGISDALYIAFFALQNSVWSYINCLAVFETVDLITTLHLPCTVTVLSVIAFISIRFCNWQFEIQIHQSEIILIKNGRIFKHNSSPLMWQASVEPSLKFSRVGIWCKSGHLICLNPIFECMV